MRGQHQQREQQQGKVALYTVVPVIQSVDLDTSVNNT